MGRHSAHAAPAAPVASWPSERPVTDPRLFDAPLPVATIVPAVPRLVVPPAPRLLRATTDWRTAPAAAAPRAPHPVAPPAVEADWQRGIRCRLPVRPYREQAPLPLSEPNSFTKRRGVALAACAIAVLGAVSGAAAVLPGKDGSASAADLGKATTRPVPTGTTAAAAESCTVAPTPVEHPRRWHGPVRASHHRAAVRPAAIAAPRASAAPAAQGSASPAPSSTPTSTPTSAPSSSAAPTPNGGGSLPADASNLGTGTWTMRNFATQESGAVLHGALKGQGAGRTVVEMTPNTSSVAAQVPGNGNNQGGLANATNPFYLLRGVTDLEDVTVQGTEQGHLYNGLYMTGANLSIKHAVVNDIPGDSNANPGETFAIGVNRASGTNTVDDLTINGGSGALSSAAGLAINNSDANWNISGLTTNDLKYSAGLALWQVRGTIDVHDYVQSGGARSLGAERNAATVNLYDPVWSAGTTGHDVTYTWDGGYSGGSINFYYSSAAKVPNRKIVVITNHASGISASVHVYIGGVQKTASEYVTVN